MRYPKKMLTNGVVFHLKKRAFISLEQKSILQDLVRANKRAWQKEWCKDVEKRNSFLGNLGRRLWCYFLFLWREENWVLFYKLGWSQIIGWGMSYVVLIHNIDLENYICFQVVNLIPPSLSFRNKICGIIF